MGGRSGKWHGKKHEATEAIKSKSKVIYEKKTGKNENTLVKRKPLDHLHKLN